GEIIRVGNYARGFSTAVVVLDIDAEADDELVTQVVEKVAGELTEDPEGSETVLSPASLTGILDVDGNRYQRRVTIETAPGQQWGVERELRARIRAGFSDADIAYAKPRFVETAQKCPRISPAPFPEVPRHDQSRPAARTAQLLRGRLRSRDLRAPPGPLLRGRRRRSRAAADVPRGGPHRSQAPPVHLPRAVLGRAEDVRRRARPSAAADAARRLPGLAVGAGRLAASHAHRPGLPGAGAAARADALGLPRSGRAVAGEHGRRRRGPGRRAGGARPAELRAPGSVPEAQRLGAEGLEPRAGPLLQPH